MKELQLQKETDPDPYILFEYSIRSPYTKESYFRRLRRFFDAIRLEGTTFESRCNKFAQKAKKNVAWCEDLVYRYLSNLKEQYDDEKKISAGTIKNRKVVAKNLLEVLKIPLLY